MKLMYIISIQPRLVLRPGKAHEVLKCDVIILQTFPFEPLNCHHEIYTADVRTCAKFQIASVNESEDREV